ncbi:MAG: metallophosphoesterase [Candidatus Bathyarchaeia archaeon]
MRILGTADFHDNVESFHRTVSKASKNNVDVVAVCGDVTHFGSIERAVSLLSILRDVSCPVLFVPGNCDPPNLVENNVEGLELIHGRCLKIGETEFLGVGGSSPSPFHTPFELSEMEIANTLERAHKDYHSGKLVLVSHDPPKNTKVDISSSGEHVGSLSVRRFVEKVKPQLVLCGHIHEARGMDRIGSSVIVNPGPARHGQCVLIDLEGDVKIELSHL